MLLPAFGCSLEALRLYAYSSNSPLFDHMATGVAVWCSKSRKNGLGYEESQGCGKSNAFRRAVIKLIRASSCLHQNEGSSAYVGPRALGQLYRPPAAVAIDKALQIRRHVEAIQRASPCDLIGYLFRDIARPAFSCIEGDNARGVGVLPVNHIGDNRLPVGGPLVGLAPGAAEPTAEIIQDQIDVTIVCLSKRAGQPPSIP